MKKVASKRPVAFFIQTALVASFRIAATSHTFYSSLALLVLIKKKAEKKNYSSMAALQKDSEKKQIAEPFYIQRENFRVVF